MSVFEEIQTKVQHRVESRHDAVLFGIFKALKKDHIKYGVERNCHCEFCLALSQYIAIRIKQHRLKKKLRDDDIGYFDHAPWRENDSCFIREPRMLPPHVVEYEETLERLAEEKQQIKNLLKLE